MDTHKLFLAKLAFLCLLCNNKGQGYISNDVINDVRSFTPLAIEEATTHLRRTLRAEARSAKNIDRNVRQAGSSAFQGVQAFLGCTKTAKQMSYSSVIQLKFFGLIKDRYNLNKDQVSELMTRMPSMLLRNGDARQADAPVSVPAPNVCPYVTSVTCDFTPLWRTFDGTCNNMKLPLTGSALQPLGRFLQPDYADGIEAFRIAKSGKALPNPREVSFTIHNDADDSSSVFTLLLMLFGQFTDHDLSRTAVSKLSVDDNGFGAVEDIMCGSDGCARGQIEHQMCAPIDVPPNDPVFTKRCLEFVRTLSVPKENCAMGPRNQLNQITSYLDGSHIYGSSKEEADFLRNKTNPDRGKLLMRNHPVHNKKKMLPSWDTFKPCHGANDTVKCFRAGDGRVNEHAALMALHIMFAREHNRIEEQLHALNPGWDGEKLYQETRRIVVAIWQRIVYTEYLPLLLGDDIMRRFGLTLSNDNFVNDYNENVKADVANAFATAAMRYGHSQIQKIIKYAVDNTYSRGHDIIFSRTFRDPRFVYNSDGTDSLLRGYIKQRSQRIDPHITEEVTNRLFTTNPPFGLGMDLAAINIQRGRDHGLPGYNQWREWCGLPKANTFQDLRGKMEDSIILKLQSLYEHVDDIDLFPAGLSEFPVKGAIVGPVFACILATQFHNSKKGDRFWHENNLHNPYPFTLEQLQAIRNVSLAKLICQNSDNITTIQKRVFVQPFRDMWYTLKDKGELSSLPQMYPIYKGQWNERLSCSTLPELNLTNWKETTPSGGTVVTSHQVAPNVQVRIYQTGGK